MTPVKQDMTTYKQQNLQDKQFAQCLKEWAFWPRDMSLRLQSAILQAVRAWAVPVAFTFLSVTMHPGLTDVK